jgi:endonuclease/exonuclease/phosphatase family metal-dependent hydrolase
MKLLTWNIGSFVTRKYTHIFFNDYEKFEYFQPKLNSALVDKVIKEVNPDFIFLQEIYDRGDVKDVCSVKDYKFKKYIDVWYGKKRTLILSKRPFVLAEKNKIYYIYIEDFTIIPIHLNSYSAKKRFISIKKIQKTFSANKKLILLGDFNIWNRLNFFIFKNDFKTVQLLKSFLIEMSAKSFSTTYLGFSLDKVFVSKDILFSHQAQVLKQRGSYMDHYPVYFEINE